MDEKGKVKYRKLCKKPLSIKYQRQLSSTSSSDPKVKKLKKSGIRYENKTTQFSSTIKNISILNQS